jgi:hypothetical protein
MCDPITATILAVVAVTSTVVGAVAQQKGLTAQKKAGRAQANQAALETQRARLQASREARLNKAQAVQAGVASGTQDSTLQLGAAANIESQLGNSLGFIGATAGNRKIQEQAARDTISANMLGNWASTVGSVASQAASIGKSGKKPAKPAAGSAAAQLGPTN